MPRWYQGEWKAGLQTCVMDSSKYTLIDGASEQEELEQQLRRAQMNLDRFYQGNHVRTIHDPKQKLPRGAILATDVDEAGVLYYIGYRLQEGGDLIRFVKPFPRQPPSP
jgi:hypothetical protein